MVGKIISRIEPQPPKGIKYMLGAESWLPPSQQSPRRLECEEWGNLGLMELNPEIKPNKAGFRVRTTTIPAPPGALGFTEIDGVYYWTDTTGPLPHHGRRPRGDRVMSERPIIFSAPMVRAILAGRKTMTRRLATSPHRRRLVGDCLWVREGWADEHPLAIQEGRYSQPGRAGIPGPPPVKYRTIYRADGEPLQIWRSHNGHPYFTLDGPADDIAAKYPTVSSNYNRPDAKGIAWENALWMPRWASRITLEITGVKVERLQDISEEDAIAEGALESGLPYVGAMTCDQARVAFSLLWDSLHGKLSWEQNPEVIVISFARRNA